MLFKIYQLKDIRRTDYAFRDWEYASSHGFDIKDYKEVYSGERKQKHILEKLFVEFNVNHPTDYRGHSMSISDVISLKKPENDYWYWYYCDDLGWKEITEIINRKKRGNCMWMKDGEEFYFDEPENDSIWEAVVSYMDDEIRETVHARYAPCSRACFLGAYIEEYDWEFENLLAEEFGIEWW